MSNKPHNKGSNLVALFLALPHKPIAETSCWEQTIAWLWRTPILSYKAVKNTIQGTLNNERLTAILEDKLDKFQRIWRPWIDYFPSSQMTFRFLELWYAPKDPWDILAFFSSLTLFFPPMRWCAFRFYLISLSHDPLPVAPRRLDLPRVALGQDHSDISLIFFIFIIRLIGLKCLVWYTYNR